MSLGLFNKEIGRDNKPSYFKTTTQQRLILRTGKLQKSLLLSGYNMRAGANNASNP